LLGFGEHCGSHGDCQSQICLTGPRGSVCSRLCAGDCPSSYLCQAFELDRNRIVNLCIPFEDVYCVQCRSSNECAAAGDRCVDLSGATYCLHDCSQNGACPDGYQCKDVALAQTTEAPDAGAADAG